MNNKPLTVVADLLGQTEMLSANSHRAKRPIQAQVSLAAWPEFWWIPEKVSVAFLSVMQRRLSPLDRSNAAQQA